MDGTGQAILMTLAIMVGLGVIGTGIALVIDRLTGGPAKRVGSGQPEGSHPATEIARIEAKDRADARALYERVTRDKLEVVKTALAMGYNRNDLEELDHRLEELIGSEKLHKLIESDSPTTPSVEGEILDADLVRQLENLRPGKGEKEGE